MHETYLRKLAHWLLSFTLGVSPVLIRPWGEAMLAELSYVRGGWAALSWAVGGVGVLVTQTLLHLFRKSNHGRTVLPVRSTSIGEDTMRKIIILLAVLSVAASLMFLLAPNFRQGMEIALNSWEEGFQHGPSSDRALLKLAAQARKQKDAEAMAFVALRIWHDPESDQLAQEAVRLDPRLTWVYSILGTPYHSPADAETRVSQLEAWDPQNATPYLIEADRILGRHWAEHNYQDLDSLSLVQGDPRWLAAMAAVFRAPTYDSYLARRLDLDRSVMRRWRIHDPMLVLGAYMWPYGMGSNISLYAKYLLDSGKDFELKGDLKQASQAYATVAHFCQAMQLQGQTEFEIILVAKTQMEAYQHLQSLAEKAGNLSESDLLTYEIHQLKQQQHRFGDEIAGRNLYGGNALTVQFSSLVVLCSACLILVWAVGKVAQRWVLRVKTGFWGSIFSAAGIFGAFGLLLGALALYLSYLPFAEAYERFIVDQGVGGFRSLNLVFSTLWIIPGTMQRVWYSSVLGLYFWYAFISLATIALIFTVTRRLGKGWRSHAAAGRTDV